MHPKTLLDIGSDLLSQVMAFSHPADAVLARYFRANRQLGSRERATLSDMVYAVLRHKLRFEHFAPSGSGPRERRLAILGLAESARGFTDGALNDTERQWLQHCEEVRTEDLLERHRHNLPDWLVEPMQQALGEEFWPWVQSLDDEAPLDLRVNALRHRPTEILQELAHAGVSTRATPYSPWGLRVVGKPSLSKVDAYVRGAVEVQDEGSQLLALLLDPKRGEMVVDFCAGAGGKTLALGAAMRNTGRLYAFDTSAHRLEGLTPRLARSGLSNVHPAALAHERDDRVKRLAGKIDRVLVDAPCSGLGTLRRHPDLKWRQTPRTVATLEQSQAAILDSASRLLKPAGRLVYATCSVLPGENQLQAQAFGQRHPDFVPVPALEILEQLKVPHAASLCHGPYLQLWPHRHGTDGFFAAVWKRE